VSYTQSVGYVQHGFERIVRSETREGAPRLGAYDHVTPIEETNDERHYRALGISHLIDRVVIDE
jgi:hypothetical protein